MAAKKLDVPALLRKLKAVKDKTSPAARKLRRLLRAAGHKGGLRTTGGAK